MFYQFTVEEPRKAQTSMLPFVSRPSNFVSAHYHPLLFTLMALCALAEIGLAAFLVSVSVFGSDSRRFYALLILFLFNASWTLLFASAYMLWVVDGGKHFLANVASSVIWLLATAILWGVAAGVMHNTRSGGRCINSPNISRCRESLTVEALGWSEFALCCITLLATCLWILSVTTESRRAKASV